MRAGTKFSSEIDEYSILTAILFVKMTGFIYPWLLSHTLFDFIIKVKTILFGSFFLFFNLFLFYIYCNFLFKVLIVDELFKKDYYRTCTVSFMKVVLFREEIITSCIN